MMRILTIFSAAVVAFTAGWFARALVPEPADSVTRTPAFASVVPVRVIPRAEATRAPTQTVRSLAPVTEAGQEPDSVGVLLQRRFAKPAQGRAVDDYYLYLPPGFERGDREWPVILYLHGRSLRGNDLTMLRRYGLPRYLGDGRALPFIVVAPQLPEGSWTDVDRLAELLEDVLDRYPVDRDRVYLTGYSMGGGGTWRMLLDHGDLFAAAAPMAATTPAFSAAYEDAVDDLPVRVFHGTADEVASFADAQAMVAALRRTGADVELVPVAGADHGDLTTIYGQPGLYDWFLAHER
jgi:predicted peptidase